MSPKQGSSQSGPRVRHQNICFSSITDLYLAVVDLPKLLSHQQFFFKLPSHRRPYDDSKIFLPKFIPFPCCIYKVLTKCEVKMAGYWPNSFSLCVYGPKRSLRPKTRESLVNKGFIIWRSGQVVPSGQDSSMFSPRVANNSERFGSSCQVMEPAR